jgi:glycosyltransferase involved in cell wall biosynthesis
MKVLHIAAGNLFGGVERMLVTLAREGIHTGGMESHFALSFEGSLSRLLLAVPVPVRMLGEVRTRTPWTVGKARGNLRSLLAAERFDAAVCHSAWCQAIFAPVIRQSGLPQVFWLHDVPPRLHWLHTWAGCCPPDLAVCNSHFTSSYLSRIFPRAKSVVIYCPVREQPADTAVLAKLRGELAPPDGTITIIHASRMQSMKGHRLLLSALSRLADGPNWSCWIVGGPQRDFERRYFESLARQAETLGVSGRVRFLGQREDAVLLMQLADIHCQPNEGPEAFGISFVEALYSRLPVVTTRLGGAAEIVTDACGRLVSPGNVQELSDTLSALLRDSSLRLRLGRAGPERARSLCGPEAQLSRIRDVLSCATR